MGAVNRTKMNTVLLDGIGQENEVGEQVTSRHRASPGIPLLTEVRHVSKTGRKEDEVKSEW